MSEEDYKKTDIYKERKEKLAQTRKFLSNHIKLLRMITEDEETTFTLYPLTWTVELYHATYFVCTFPLQLAYAISLQQLQRCPFLKMRKLSIPLPLLTKQPLAYYTLLVSAKNIFLYFQ